MKILAISELLCLTKVELLDLRRSLLDQLAQLPEGSAERHDTITTLTNVRAVLARPDFAFRRGARPSPAG